MTKRKTCPHCAAKDIEIKRLRDQVTAEIKAHADAEQREAQRRAREGR